MGVMANVISGQGGGEALCSYPALGEAVVAGATEPVTWQLPQETPVALQINSEPYTVMMATPADLRDFALASLRSRIGLVAQDPFIFSGTLRENIALARPGATLEEVSEAARAAGLEAFIARLPERYDTVIGERGANLSGGQRQRLAIARALVRQPAILLFDEATSHLDTATERAIQDNLKTVLAGKTVVLVAHRLSTIREADLIYVLHRGRVVQAGTHRQLLAQEGWYQTLWRSQTAEDDSGLPAQATFAVPSRHNGHRHTAVEGSSHA